MKKTILLVALASLLVGCKRASEQPSPSQGGTVPSVPSARELPRNRPSADSYSDVVDRAAPAVVTIRSARRARPARQFPFLDQLFGRRGAPDMQERRALGLGSGVIVSGDGLVLTNHHVIDGAEEITIEMVDRRTFAAKLLGSDPPSDLAVLKIDGSNVPVLQLGNSDDVRVGDVVLAIGNPLGLGQTVTSGIISAKGRATGLSDGSFEDFLQTDAAINRGNSGGALINTRAELVGINSQIVSPSGGFIGIGFAIPTNMARGVMDQLVRSGKVRRGQIGIMGGTVTDEIVRKLDLKERRGVYVAEVVRGGPADRAGIRANDVIIALNGERVDEMNHFRIRVSSTAPGSDVTLTIIRGGREQQVRVQLAELRVQQQREQDAEPE